MHVKPMSYLLNWTPPPPILGVENVELVLAVIGDKEPHLFKFWDAEDVSNTFRVDPIRNGNKVSLLVGGRGPCISIPK